MPTTFFIISILSIAILSILIFVKQPLSYFKTKEGKGVAYGIILSVVISLGLVLFVPNKGHTGEYTHSKESTNSLEYFSSAELFVGLDYTKRISPMCDVGVNNDHLTSNIGLKMDVLSSSDSNSNVYLKYTHHSCAFNPDNKSYDAFGIGVNYKFW